MSKRLTETSKLVDKTKLYEIADAINLVKQTAKAKFDETIEIHIRRTHPRKVTRTCAER